ncbi:MAG: hypothetical protein KTR29_11340 [Rhodothermaceae bacterium]|nr:hypothetical protein [Rhodothermaceae bacterium]
MSKVGYSVLVMIALWAISIGIGIYVLRAKNVDLDHAMRAEKVARLKKAELDELFLQETRSESAAKDATRRWFARYKVIPEELRSPEVIGYLNQLTQSGFKNFDVRSTGSKVAEDYNYHTFAVEGRGYFSSLYSFVWDIENNRNFYRIENLTLDNIDLITEDKQTGKPRLQIMVSFHMNLSAYFSGTEGVSAPEDLFAELLEGESLPSGWSSDLPPVPKDILPDESPAINPFYPGILTSIPPNTDGLLEIEHTNTELISIVGGKAVFKDPTGFRSLGPNDRIYLGKIVEIDPVEGRVVARLNKGGIIDEVVVYLNDQGAFRQAIGGTVLSPAGNW